MPVGDSQPSSEFEPQPQPPLSPADVTAKGSGPLTSPAPTNDVDSVTRNPARGQTAKEFLIESMDQQVTTIQPGGGVVMSMELVWGKLRRRLLKSLFPGYVARMRELRKGQPGNIPFDPIDPRDVKYYRNQATYYWEPADDPFRWRDDLPFVRVGLAELILMGGGSLILTILLGWLWWPLAIPMAVVTACLIWFFRDPVRIAPTEIGQVVSPADGRIATIIEIDDEELGPCYEVGIFLSIFNVHANRAPVEGLVTSIRYRPGKMLNALRPESAKENERLEVMIAASERPHRLVRVNQITGQFARRIVCWVRPGNRLGRGEMFGMIKLGSRTELILPRLPGLEIVTRVGEKVHAGTTILACYKEPTQKTEQAVRNEQAAGEIGGNSNVQQDYSSPNPGGPISSELGNNG